MAQAVKKIVKASAVPSETVEPVTEPSVIDQMVSADASNTISTDDAVTTSEPEPEVLVESATSETLPDSPDEIIVMPEPIIEPPPVVEPEPMPVIEVPSVEKPVQAEIINVSDTTSVYTIFIEQQKTKGSAGTKFVISSMETYLNTMRFGQIIDPIKGAMQNVNLLNTIRTVANNPDSNEFSVQWRVLLAFFYLNKEPRQPLADTAFNRFMEQWPKSKVDETCYYNLMNLLSKTCDPDTRKRNLGFISLPRTLEKGLTQTAKLRISGFYANM